MAHAILTCWRISDAELHAAAATGTSSAVQRATQAAAIVRTCFQEEHEVSVETRVNFDLHHVVLVVEAPVSYEVVMSCPILAYGHDILATVHAFSVAVKRNHKGVTLRYVTTVPEMNAAFTRCRVKGQIKTFAQSCMLGGVAFFIFIAMHRVLYGTPDTLGEGAETRGLEDEFVYSAKAAGWVVGRGREGLGPEAGMGMGVGMGVGMGIGAGTGLQTQFEVGVDAEDDIVWEVLDEDVA